jgi:hypothetical protein
MCLTPKLLARACRQMAPVLDSVDVETQEALTKLVLDVPVTQEDAIALATALLLELQRRRPARRR